MHFTQTQQKAILFLIAIFTLVIAYHFVKEIMFRPEPLDFSQFEEKFNAKKDSIEKLLDQEKAHDDLQASLNTKRPGDSAETRTIVNINSAGFDELTALPRIGPVIAQRIIDYRNQNGGFASKDDIKRIRGVGEKTYENLKDLISVE
jgi:comEA protein